MLVEVNRLEASRPMLASRVEITALQLKALAGIAPEVPLSIRGELTLTAAVPEAAEAAQHALATRPDLAVARNDVAMGAAKIRKEQAEGRWDASVNVGYQRQNFGFDLNAEQRRFIEVENGYTDILKQVYDAAVEIARATGGTTGPER